MMIVNYPTKQEIQKILCVSGKNRKQKRMPEKGWDQYYES